MPRKKDTKRIRKPMNAFFYYRQHVKDEIEATCSTSNSNEISKIAAERWKGESEQVQQLYRNKSKEAYDAFKLKHPDFIWNHKRKLLPKPVPICKVTSVERCTPSPKETECRASEISPTSTIDSSSTSSSSTSSTCFSISPYDLFPFQVSNQIPQINSAQKLAADAPNNVMDFEELVDSFINEFNPYVDQIGFAAVHI
ncbi:hypothetical protein HDV06_003178 [Boothiomyces sp. JEL0866]|nr:hypothetical protein HDV06_003178 [Boothiomyces sp. JEL0866]